VKALIIGAGQGKRLLPLTETTPKALVNIGGKSLFEWQLDALVECGVSDVVFVAGFNIEAVRQEADRLANKYRHIDLRVIHNPFHAIADNLATCWTARTEMTDDFLLLNSDTLFSAPVLRKLLACDRGNVTLAVDHKDRYDSDDMKVELDGTRLVDIGKTLEDERVNGESIGMLLFRDEGPTRFVAALEAAMESEAALKHWFLSVIAAMAGAMTVETANIHGLDWCEIDFPHDVGIARKMITRWQSQAARNLPSANMS
jgi:choline kinase